MIRFSAAVFAMIVMLFFFITVIYAGGVDPDIANATATAPPIATSRPQITATPVGAWPGADPSGPWTPTPSAPLPTTTNQPPTPISPTATPQQATAGNPTATPIAAISMDDRSAHLPFDRTDGRFVDLVSGWQGVIDGAHWAVPGAIGNGLVLGKGALGTMGSNPAIQIGTAEFTFSWWVKLDDDEAFTGFGKATQDLIETCVGGHHGPESCVENYLFGEGFSIATTRDSIIAQIEGSGGIGFYMSMDHANLFGDGGWHHVALVGVRDVPDGIRVFVDGQQIGTYNTTLNLAAVIQTDAPLNFSGGGIDDWRLYKRALTASEIFTIYANR